MLNAFEEEERKTGCLRSCVVGQQKDDPVHEEHCGALLSHHAALPIGPSVYYSANVYMDTQQHHKNKPFLLVGAIDSSLSLCSVILIVY